MSPLPHSGFALDRENVSYSVFPFLFNCTVFLQLIFHLLYARHLKNLYERRYSLVPNVPLPNVFFNWAFWKSRFSHFSEKTSALLYFKISTPVDGLGNFYQNLLLWRYSRPAWTRSCEACCRWPCFVRRSGLDDPQKSLPTLTILWFCDSVICNVYLCMLSCVAGQNIMTTLI